MKNNILLIALATASVLAIVNKPNNQSPVAGDVQIEPTKVARGNGGQKKYVGLFKRQDGGISYLEIGTPGCVRRKSGAPVAACRRNHPTLGLIDQGQLNRFPQSEARGGQCQPVSCSVFHGQPPQMSDDQLLDAGY